MNAQLTSTARRFALTLGVAGIAALGSVAVAPAALAAPVGSTVADSANNSGPDMFLEHYVGDTTHGKVPVFLCEDKADKADKKDADKKDADKKDADKKDADKTDKKDDKKDDKNADKDAPKQHNNCIDISSSTRF